MFHKDGLWILLVNHKGDYVSEKPIKVSWRQYYKELLWSLYSDPFIENFSQIWRLHGHIHRWTDLPAIIDSDATVENDNFIKNQNYQNNFGIFYFYHLLSSILFLLKTRELLWKQ